jgi:hypothetical protein
MMEVDSISETNATPVSRGNGKDENPFLPVEEDMIMNHGWMKEFNESPLYILTGNGAVEKTEARRKIVVCN